MKATAHPIPERLTARRLRFAGPMVVGVVVFLSFANAIGGSFVDMDDPYYVFRNPTVLSGVSWSGLWKAFREPIYFGWMPLTVISYQVDASLFGLAPWGFHLTNVVLHACSAAVLCAALTRMTNRAGRSCAASLLWGLHPMRVESVAWVSERKDVLSVFFFVATLLAYEWYSRRQTPVRGLLVILGTLASLASKATAVTMPLLLLLLDVWPLERFQAGIGPSVMDTGSPGSSRKPSRSAMIRLLVEKAPLVAVAGVFSAVTLATQAKLIQPSVSARPLFMLRIPNALCAVNTYLADTFWPVGLHPAHGHPGLRGGWTTFFAGCGVVAFVAAIVFLWRRFPPLAVGMAWFLVGLLPVLGIVQTGFQSHADRFTYIPHIGLAFGLVWSVAVWAERLATPAIARILFCAAVIASVAACQSQIMYWRSPETLWSRVIELEPENLFGLAGMGASHQRRGDIETAERYLQSAIDLGSNTPALLTKMARVQLAKGNLDKARSFRDWAVREGPEDDLVRGDLEDLSMKLASAPAAAAVAPADPNTRRLLSAGLVAARAERFAEALEAFERAAAEDPGSAEAHNNAGLSCAKLGRDRDAERWFRDAIRIDPRRADYRVNLARLLVSLGRSDEAREELEAAVVADPSDTEAGILLKKLKVDAVRRR